MGKYRRYKNRIEMFLASDRGKRALNITYSWGASIVILGAMFKILHLPYGNQILFIAMMVESFVFFVSGFDRPFSEYHWEDVFPVLKSKNPLDRPDFGKGGNGLNAGSPSDDEDSAGGLGGSGMMAGGGNISGAGNISGGGSLNISGNLDVSEEDTKNLSESIKKLSGAAEQLSKMAELTEATEKYLQQMSTLSDDMSKFGQVTNSLTSVSDQILQSYKSITDHSDGINQNSQGYVQQMELLNRNISGLNTIYEIQLKGISSQIDSIDHINAGLQHIREMYDGSVSDSSAFRGETERMTRQLSELNQVYSRLLQAMTVNMNVQNAVRPQPQAYAQQPYQQQPAYPPQQPYQQPSYPPQQPQYGGYPQQPQQPYNNPSK